MRANADGIIVGAGTMRQEPNMTAHVFDEELESKRAEIGKQSIPYNIISSLDGSDIPFDHILFKSEVPIIINTSPKGFQIEKEDIEKIIIDNKNLGKIPVIVTGEGRFTDTNSLFKVLKYMGIDILLVESPSYVHHLISEAKYFGALAMVFPIIEFFGGVAGNNMPESLRILMYGSMIVAIIWASIVALAIDGNFEKMSLFFIGGAICTFLGLIHSKVGISGC